MMTRHRNANHTRGRHRPWPAAAVLTLCAACWVGGNSIADTDERDRQGGAEVPPELSEDEANKQISTILKGTANALNGAMFEKVVSNMPEEVTHYIRIDCIIVMLGFDDLRGFWPIHLGLHHELDPDEFLWPDSIWMFRTSRGVGLISQMSPPEEEAHRWLGRPGPRFLGVDYRFRLVEQHGRLDENLVRLSDRLAELAKREAGNPQVWLGGGTSYDSATLKRVEIGAGKESHIMAWANIPLGSENEPPLDEAAERLQTVVDLWRSLDRELER